MRLDSKVLALIGVIVIVLTSVKCDKNRSEEDLSINIDASAVEISPSANFDFNLNIQSEIPESGVSIYFVIKGEIDDHIYYEKLILSKSASNKLTIFALPAQMWCICTITVTSNSNRNNVAFTSFRLGRK